MKKNYLSLFLFLWILFLGNLTSYSQCVPRSNFFQEEIAANLGCGTYTQFANYSPGQYFRTPVLQGGSYTISTCGAPTDTQITGFQGNNTTPSIFYNDDNGPECTGLAASITYVPTFTDYIRVNINQYNCLPGGTSSITVRVRQNNNLTITSSNASMCAGQTRTLTATPAPVVVAPLLNSGNAGTFSGTGVSGTTFTAPTPAGASQVYTITYTFGYCTTTQNITVFKAPTTATAGSDQTICVATANLAGNAPSVGTGSWSVVSGTGTVTTPTSPTSTVTGLVAGASVTLRWTISNGVCPASSDDVIITRQNLPTTATAGSDQTICVATANLAGNTPLVGTGSWSVVSGTGTVTTPTSPTSTVTGLVAGASVTLRWTISNGVCPVSFDDVVVTRQNLPTTANAGSDQTICVATANLAGNTPLVGTGSWSVVSGTGTVTTPTSPTSTVTGLVAGASVTLRWTISNGVCPASSDDVIITRQNLPTTATAGSDQTVCVATANLAGNTPSVGTGSWSVVSGTGTVTTPTSPASTVTGLVAGASVTLRWTISNGVCPASSDDVIITRQNLPTTANAGSDQTVCVATATLAGNTPSVGTGSWSVVSGTGTVTTPTSPTSTVTGLVAGASVTLRWTISNGVCPASSDDVIITRQNLPTTANAGSDQTVCVATATLAGNTPSVGTGSWSVVSGTGTVTTPTSPASTVTGLVAGASVTLRWTISNGVCPVSFDDVVVTRPTQLVASATAPAIACNGGQSTVTVSATGGTAPYTGTGTFSRPAGTHTFPVTDANGCTTSTTITITEPTLLVASSSSTAIACNGGQSTVTVSATGGTAPYTGTGTFSRPAGTHTFTVTDANGCATSTTITITQPTQVVASSSSTAIACNGGQSTVTVSATGGTAPYTGTGTFSRPAGTYTFNVTDANGCATSTTITITQPTQVVASSSATAILCNGGQSTVTVSATGGTAPYTGTGTFSRPAGTYTFNVTDANNCTTSTTITITQPTQVVASSSSTAILCNGGQSTVTVSATGGTAPYTGTGTFSRPAGTYTFNVTDANNCTTSTTITITQPTQVVASSSSTAIACNGGQSTVTVSATGGTAPYTGTGTFSRPAGTYTFNVTDANGCATSTTITITQPTQVVASSSATAILCNGGQSTVTVSATGGTAPYTGTGTFSRPAGTHTFNVTDANGCATSTTITITEPTQLVASSSSTAVACNGGQSTVTVSATGGTAPYTGTGTFSRPAGTHTFTVTDANGCSDDVTITIGQPTLLVASSSSTAIACNGGQSTVTVSATGGTAPYTGTGTFSRPAGTYTFNVTDANGCATSTTITITEPTQVVASATSSAIACFGGQSTVTVTGAGGTPGYTGTGTFSRPAGTHTFTVTDANGCSDDVTITIGQPTLLVASSSSTAIACNGGQSTVTVSATGGTAPYTGTGTFSRPAGTYTFNVTDANGCATSTTITITEPTLLVASSSSTAIACNGGQSTVTVSATGGTVPYTGTGTFSRPAGTYTFNVTDANGCATSTTITITEPTQVVASATSSAIACFGGQSTVTVTGAGGTPGYTGTGTFSRPAGTHTFTVTDANGCSDDVTITIGQPTLLVASSSSTAIACNGGQSTVTVSATGGTAPYTGTGTFSRPAGTYTFNVTDANGCATSTTITITEPTLLVASSSSTAIACNGGQSTVTVSATGGTVPYTGTGTFSRPAGTYTFNVTDANGCATSTTITITEPTQVVASATSSAIACFGGQSTVTVTGAGGTPGYTGTGTFSRPAGTHTFTVTDANGCSDDVTITIGQPTLLVASSSSTAIACNGGQSTVTVSATGGTAPYTGTGTFSRPAGTYTFNVTDANGCATSTTITITEPTQVVASATSSAIACFGGQSTVTVTGAGGTPGYTGTGTFSRPAGTHTFTVTDANGCSDDVTITIGQPTLLVASATATEILCFGETTDITVTAVDGTLPYTGNITYTESAGTYTYTVTDAIGCTSDVTITVTEPPLLVASATATEILCFGETTDITVTAVGGTLPYSGNVTYTESAGTYTYTVTDAKGCTDDVTITVTEPPLLVASATATEILCFGETTDITVTAVGGTLPYSGNVTYTESAGTYTYAVTDAKGCTDDVTITVTEPPLLVASATATEILCFGETTDITVTAVGGTLPYSGNVTYTESAGTYTYTVTDAKGCTSDVTITVTEPPLLVASATATEILCFGETTDITVTAVGGTLPYSGNVTYTESAGTYTYTVTDAKGCTSDVTITVTEPPLLVASATATEILCFGETTDITVTAVGGTLPYSGNVTYTESAGTYTYTVTDAKGCTSDVTITVTEPPLLVASATATEILCFGETTDITVTAVGGTLPYSGNVTYTESAGTYTYTVTDAKGCTSDVTITVTEPPLLVASATATEILCFGETTDITVTAVGGTLPYSGNVTYTESAGTYTYTVTDAKGCTDDVTITVTEPPLLVASATATEILCFGETTDITVTAVGGTLPYSGNVTYTESAGTYTYTVTDAKGCTSDVTITVTEPPLLVASATATEILCFGETTDITVTAVGGTLPYSGNVTYTESAGTYTYTVTDAKGCTSDVTITVTEPPLLVASATATEILCFGETTDITVTAVGGTLPYSGNVTYTESAGTYTYTVTDAKGCTSDVTITVTEPPLLVASATATEIRCNGETTDITVTAVGGTLPYSGNVTYTESAGTYTYTVTDAKGCTSDVTITVTEPPLLVASATATEILCNGETTDITVTAVGGTLPYSGNVTYTESAGTYTYTVTDAKGCTSDVTITVTEPPLLVASATATEILCFGETTDITVTAVGGTLPYSGNVTYTESAGTYTYTVTDAKGCTSDVTITVTEPPLLVASATATEILCFGETTDITVTAVGGTLPYSGNVTYTESAGTYTYTVTDAKGCTDDVTITVTEPPLLVASATATEILCFGETTDITVTAVGGTLPYSGNVTYTESAGTYTYTVTDAKGCTSDVTITVTEPPLLVASATATEILCNGETTDITVTAVGGTLPYSGNSVYTVSAGTYTYTVTDAKGCTDDVTITVSAPTQLELDLAGCSTVYSGMGWEFACANITATASNGTPGYTYDWSTNESTNAVIVCPDATTTYSVTATDSKGCEVTQSWTVEVVDLACNLSGSQAPSGVSKISSGPKCSLSVPNSGSGSGSGSCSLPSEGSSKCSGVSGSAFKSVKSKKGSVLMCFEGETYCVKKKYMAKKMLCGFTLGPCDAQQTMACNVPNGPDTNIANCPCDGRVTLLVVKYIGPSNVDITANAKDCGVNITNVSGVTTGEIFYVTASSGGLAYLRNTTYLSVDGSPHGQVAIPTNCCDNPVGRVFFPFLIMAYQDESGNVCAAGGGTGGGNLETSIGQASKDTEIKADKATITQYPNPASTDATFEFTVPTTEELTVSIVNVRGELIADIYTGEAQAGNNYTVTYDVSKLQSGIYFVHMNTSDGVIKKKFVVLK